MNELWKKPTPCYRAVLKAELPGDANIFYQNANNMSPLFCGSTLFVPGAGDGEYPSEDVVVVGDAARSCYLLAGAVTCLRSMTYFRVNRKNNRTEEIIVEQPEIKPEEVPEELVVLRGSDWRKLLIEYAEITAGKMNVRPIDASKNLAGYCSWYYYYAKVSADALRENLAALSASKSPYAKGIFQIDSGYQPFHGDWLELRDDWKTPLETIAQEASSHGMIPGIWLTPTMASTGSRLYREHPDWFIHDETGKLQIYPGWTVPPDNDWICLDGSHPEARRHMQNVFRTMWNYGFRYFKLDALGYGFAYGKHYEPNATSVSAFRQLFAAIREAVPEAYLLGCSSPFMPLLGYVDGCRVGCDTGRTWSCDRDMPNNTEPHPGRPCIRNAWHDTITHWWMFDRYFRADPDVVMARQDGVSYSEREARISTVGAILSGVSITSDNFTTIAPERRKLLECAAQHRLRNMIPLDWKPNSWPHAFGGDIDGKRAVALINDCEVPLTFALADYGLKTATELLTGAPVQETITLSAHDAAILTE